MTLLSTNIFANNYLMENSIAIFQEAFNEHCEEMEGSGYLSTVMSYCEGGNLNDKLKQYIKEKKKVEEHQVMEWLVQIALALEVCSLINSVLC